MCGLFCLLLLDSLNSNDCEGERVSDDDVVVVVVVVGVSTVGECGDLERLRWSFERPLLLPPGVLGVVGVRCALMS